MSSLYVFLQTFCFYFVELSILFLSISFFMALIHHKYETKIKTFLNQNSISSYLKAILLGSLTPFCSCSTIPLFRSLLRSGIKLSIAWAYLMTSPLVNPIIIVMLFMSFGFALSLFYILFLVVIITLASLMLSKIEEKSLLVTDFLAQNDQSCCNQTAKEQNPLNPLKRPSSRIKRKSGFFVDSDHHANLQQNMNHQHNITQTHSCCNIQEPNMMCCDSSRDTHQYNKNFIQQIGQKTWMDYKKILPYLMIGMGLGALIHGFVPQGFLEEYFQEFHFLDVMIAAFLGIFLYVRIESLIPIGLALIDAGVSQGVVMSFLIAGAGCSLPELILLKSMFTSKMLSLFIGMVLGIAILFGWLILWILA